MFYFVYLLLLGGVWQGWQRVRRCEVGTLGLVVRKGVSDRLGVSRGGVGGWVYEDVLTLIPPPPPSPTPTTRASNN